MAELIQLVLLGDSAKSYSTVNGEDRCGGNLVCTETLKRRCIFKKIISTIFCNEIVFVENNYPHFYGTRFPTE